MNVRTRPYPSIRGHVVRRAVVVSATGVAIACAAFGAVAVMADHATLDMTTGSADSSAAVVAVDPGTSDPGATALVEQHDCWTDAAGMPADMAGELPGHVVAGAAGAAPTYSSDLVWPALETVYGGGDGHLVVYAFCR
jgi:hypothetical protein